MNLNKIRLRTKRLLLVPISPKYSKQIFKEFTPQITNFMYPKPNKNIEELEKVFTNKYIECLKKGTDLQMIILKKNSKTFLGAAAIHKIHRKVPEFGVWIKKSAHGKKYGQEAIIKLKQWADKNLDYSYIQYPVDKRNKASRKIPELFNYKIGKEYKEKSLSGKVLEIIEYHIYPNKK